MAYPAWFNPEHYAGEKVSQMNAMQYKGLSDWDNAGYKRELESFRDINGQPIPGTDNDERAYQNFLATNGSGYNTAVVTRADLNVSPNEYFDVSVYVANLAAYANRTDPEGAPAEGWTQETMLLHLYNDLRMSAWDHYTNVGMYAGINPSNEFDTNDYLRQRQEAMNNYENSDGSVGWNGSNAWTITQVQEYLQSMNLNPIMDCYGAGKEVFNITPRSPETDTEVSDTWTPWTVPPPFNPYEQDVTSVNVAEVKAGEARVNTRFGGAEGKEAEWNGAVGSDIAPTDTIVGGADAYNTLAIKMNAPWPGFQGGGATNVGRVELTHGEASPGTPYTFDARNIPSLERVDINAGTEEAPGTGAISLKNLSATVKQVNIYNLDRMNDTQTQITGIEFAEGVNSGSDDSLTIGVANVGGDVKKDAPYGQDAPAPIALEGVEHITLNALQGENFVNLQSVSGARTLAVTGGGNIKVSSVPNGIRSYDASGASGRTNILTSDLNTATTVKGGIGVDTITLTQNLSGTPTSWTGVESLAVSPGVAVNISAANIQGLRDLWVDSGKSVTITNLPTTGLFTIMDTYAGSTGNITVNGDIRNLAFNNANYTAAEGATVAPVVSSNVSGGVSINAVGEGTLGGKYTFASAKGELGLSVGEKATLGLVEIIAPEANSLSAQIDGKLAGEITLDAGSAASMEVNTGDRFSLAGSSSLNNLETLTIGLDGADAGFYAYSMKKAMPMVNQVTINGEGDVDLPTLGSASMTKAMQIIADGVNYVGIAGLRAGGSANIVADIKAEGHITLGNVTSASSATIATAQGDVHLTLEGAGVDMKTVTGADIFMDLSGISGDASAELAARESINYTGADGSDFVSIKWVGSAVPSSINLGTGGDSLFIERGAVSRGQRVTMTVDLGNDKVTDVLGIDSQSGAKLGVYVENFHDGEDVLAGFSASHITRSQGQALLSAFGVANVAEGSLQLLGVGSGNGVLYDGDLYAFNGTTTQSATTMVVLAGVNTIVNNLRGTLPDVSEAPAA